MQWEYKVVRETGKYFGASNLNEYGAEGWELTSVVATGQRMEDYVVYYFKRPKAVDSPENAV